MKARSHHTFSSQLLLRTVAAMMFLAVLALATVWAKPVSRIIPIAQAEDEVEKTLVLAPEGPANFGQSGTVKIEVKNGHTSLEFSLSGLTPNSIGTAWEILDTTQAPFANDATLGRVAIDPLTGSKAAVTGSTPAAADNAGFTAGNGLDPNGFIVDALGNARFELELNYDIFQPGVAPVVLRPGATERSGCVLSSSGTVFNFPLDSAYMHVFGSFASPTTSPSFPVVDAPLKAKLVRANVARLVLVEHLDGLTHGHIPGQGVVGNNCGDHAARLSGALANAVVDD